MRVGTPVIDASTHRNDYHDATLVRGTVTEPAGECPDGTGVMVYVQWHVRQGDRWWRCWEYTEDLKEDPTRIGHIHTFDSYDGHQIYSGPWAYPGHPIS